METLLEIKDLKTYFYSNKREIRAVDGVDLTIYRGETLALVGESGSGKSITSLSIMGLIPNPPGKIVSGQVLFEGRDLVRLSEKDMQTIRGNRLAMIFQEPMTSLNPVFTIGFQLTEPLRIHQKMSKKEAEKRALALLELVGIGRAAEILKSYPHQLSGGMRQRVMIAMAMANDPQLLIADEPTTALDVTIQAQILSLMKDLKAKMLTAILLITHDLGVVAEMADRVVVMYAGQIVEEAPLLELFDNPRHPYTRGLMAAIPRLEDEKEHLDAIPGTVPPAYAYPKGCRFAPRCPLKTDRCTTEMPELIQVGKDHKARCLYAG
ncbi:MAG: Oligopeptide transport system permease protein OppB [Candidatus Carbobacillus altaicus]|uniref:Oligopeptide transport system permease protein OppB n=1 Tax=Candidatus Carbonibacillus altaicus TaxID=2163959 RepID=A0A2R6XY73_9BACL|nr:MAG: Oligopeptide transport system permease protein OppB [Candidatus Carbobacillus altaicus]